MHKYDKETNPADLYGMELPKRNLVECFSCFTTHNEELMSCGGI